MMISSSIFMVSNLLSSVDKKFLDLPSTLNLMVTLSGKTIGRTLRLCGAIGVMTKFPELGKIIGPPQLKEYPVEPVGVASIIPSAQ